MDIEVYVPCAPSGRYLQMKMSKYRVNTLEYSWKAFLSAEKAVSSYIALSNYAETDPTPKNCEEEKQATPQTASIEQISFGGLLNNLNDPLKRSKRDYGFKPRKTATRKTSPTLASAHSFSETPVLKSALVCRSVCPGSHFSTPKRTNQLVSPTNRLIPLRLTDMKSAGELNVTLKRVLLKARNGTSKSFKNRLPPPVLSRDRTTDCVAVGTSDIEDEASDMLLNTRPKRNTKLLDFLESEQSVYTAPVSHTPHNNVISQCLEHMLREQAHQRAKSRPSRAVHSKSSHILRGYHRESKDLEEHSRPLRPLLLRPFISDSPLK